MIRIRTETALHHTIPSFIIYLKRHDSVFYSLLPVYFQCLLPDSYESLLPVFDCFLYPVLWTTVLSKFCTEISTMNLLLLVKWWCKYLFSYKYKIITNLITLSVLFSTEFSVQGSGFARLRRYESEKKEKEEMSFSFL